MMTTVLVGLVAVHLLPADTRIAKCVAFPGCRGTVLQSTTAHGIYYSCSGSYMSCSNLSWVKDSSTVGQRNSENHLTFPESAFVSDFPKEVV